ncbi:hypothetical protein XELAEV_18036683mg [Xenopus laevis]|uniref:Uncharacterized protein n=1 Tax=Xenopus laevis TaxID=8355 RepID=A0A974CAW0_XENLA|nr:hypothetical protein XELAEV_18036683mg [Xenopus laevis]
MRRALEVSGEGLLCLCEDVRRSVGEMLICVTNVLWFQLPVLQSVPVIPVKSCLIKSVPWFIELCGLMLSTFYTKHLHYQPP